jgi:hypothetical protein
MRHTTISGHHVAHQMVAALWVLAGIFAVIVVGDAVTLLALAIVTTGWWILSRVEHRLERNHAEMAPVTHLRPALSGQRDLKKTAAHASWRGPSAA